MQYLIDDKLVQEIQIYLVKQPYHQVATKIQSLAKLEQAPKVAKEKK